MTCPLCTRTDPHQHDLGVVLNARRYCPDGERHDLVEERRWLRRRLCPGDTACGNCVRGLLCSNCNMAIGLFKEDAVRMRAALVYLDRP